LYQNSQATYVNTTDFVDSLYQKLFVQYLLNLFENIVDVRFLNHSVYAVSHST